MKIVAVALAVLALGASGAYAGIKGFGFIGQVPQNDYRMTSPADTEQLIQVITIPNFGTCAVFNFTAQQIICK